MLSWFLKVRVVLHAHDVAARMLGASPVGNHGFLVPGSPPVVVVGEEDFRGRQAALLLEGLVVTVAIAETACVQDSNLTTNTII